MLTNYPIEQDVDIAYTMMRHWCDRFFPVVPYRRLLTTVSELDDVHGEIPEEYKRWASPIDLRAFVNPEKPMQNLTKFSLEEERSIQGSISVPHLLDSGLATRPKHSYEVTMVAGIGDLLVFHDVVYKVLVFKPGARFANTDLILYMDFYAEKYRVTTANFFKS